MRKKVIISVISIVMLAVMLIIEPLGIMTGSLIKAEAADPLMWPVPGHTGTSRGWQSGHYALDINDSSINGAQVVAAKEGTVVKIYKCNNNHGTNPNVTCCYGFGNGLVIKGTDGRYYVYAHMQAGSIPSDIYNSAYVQKGQMLGKVGMTGAATGPHLHFGITYNKYGILDADSAVNPSNETYIYSTDLPFVKWIDGPSNNATYTNEYVTVFGWAVNKDNVSLITCTVNDQTYISDQFYAKDIADLFSGKGYPTDKGRFECKIPFWAFVDGSNTITIRFWCGQTELGSETRTVVYNNKGTQSISDGQYYIKSALDNNYVLDLKDGGTANGTNIILNKYSGSDSQKFYVKYVGDGYYELISEKSGKCVDVAGGNKAPGTNVQIWDYYGVKSQKYIIRQADNGTYYLVSGTGGAYVDVYGAKIASGTNIQIWSGNNNNAQKWKFEAVKQTPASDGWYYSYGLPSNITSDKYDIQYQNTYAKNQAASPGSGWVNSGVYSTEYVKDGGVYESPFALTTSDTVKLVSKYYYHYCSASLGINVNYTLSGSWTHYDKISNTDSVSVYKEYTDGDDSRYKYYHLKWKDGTDAYCSTSRGTCDGTWGSHGNRSYYWYAMYQYQNYKKQNVYHYTKTDSWSSTKDSSAFVVKYRYKVKDIVPTSVTLNKTRIDFSKKSDKVTLTATVAPQNAANKNVTWSSSNTSIATVDSNGVVTSVGNGTAVITAKTAVGGKTAQCKVTVNIPLTVSASKSENDKNVVFTADAAGGKAGYTYKFIVYNKTTGTWGLIQNYSSKNTCTWKKGSAGDRDFYVDVKDADGKVVRSRALNVKIESSKPTSVLTPSAVAVSAGDKLTLTASTNKSGCTYKFLIYNPATNQWFKLQDFGSKNTYTWTAGSAGTRQFYVDVKDSDGNVTRSKVVNVTIGSSGALSVKTTVSVKTSKPGDKITFTAVGTGGKAGYTYKMVVYNKTTKTWGLVQNFNANNKITWTAGSAGDREFYVDVKDASGKVVRSSALNVKTSN
jgi:hypothetical protein